ncbi:MAG TPA: MATE family efflux transporter [Acidimicrobiia bacterium]|nr:MATE family efflux transporter [Acidimicrobiia bacterium]
MIRLRSPHDRAIAALAIPALGSLIAEPVLSLVDTAFVGRLGIDELGALGVASAVFALAFFVFNFLEYGTTTEVARAVGRGDIEAAGRATATSLALGAVCGVAVAGLLVAFRGPIAGALGATGGVRSGAVTYIGIRALAAPAVLVVRAAHGAYRGYQDTRTPFVVALGLNAVNLLLDPILIFALDWGISGAAWATVTAQWVGALWFLVLLRRGAAGFGLVGARPVAGEVRAFLRVGRDLAIRTGALLSTFTVATAVATRVSDAAVAAHQVLSQVFLFLALALDALAIAAQALVAKVRGSGDGRSARELADRLAALGVALGVILLLTLAALAPFVPGWFTPEPDARRAIADAYPILVLVQPVAALVFVWDGVFIGAGDFGFLAVAMVVASAVAIGLLVLVLPLGWGLVGVWWSLAALLAARAVTLGWRRVARAGPFSRPAAG